MKIIVVPDPNEKWTDRVKRKAQAKWRQTKDWLGQNKEAVIVLAPVVAGTTVKIISMVSRSINVHNEAKLKDLYWYDPRLGKYWQLRRKLSSNESLAVQRKYRNGEALGDIFDSMKVLK